MIQPRLWQRVAPAKHDRALILGIALESKIANLKSQIRIPRGVTVTQRPLEAILATAVDFAIFVPFYL